MASNEQITLVKRPAGLVSLDCFGSGVGDIPEPGEREVLVRATHLVIDPAIRSWLGEAGSGYLPPVEIGAAVRGSGIGEIVKSNVEGYEVGASVTAMTGWQQYCLATNDRARPFEYATLVPDGASALEAATVLGSPGWTAWIGINKILDVQEGESVLVTSTSSLVGSVAGQLAKQRGAYVVGTAGSDEKCAWCIDDLGFDDCINYKTEDVDQRIKAAFPQGIDAVFENVGGEMLDLLFRRIAVGGRIALCGSVSLDNSSERYRLANYDRLMSRRATMMGFNTIDYQGFVPQIMTEFRELLDDGRLKFRANTYQGLEQAPQALVDLYTDSAIGKIVIEL